MGQIISLLTQFEVVTVFAVTEDVLPTYQVIYLVTYYILIWDSLSSPGLKRLHHSLNIHNTFNPSRWRCLSVVL